MIVEKQMKCRLAGETEVLGEKTCPSATFVQHKIPHDQTRGLNPDSEYDCGEADAM
jgi:hypothetical protein